MVSNPKEIGRLIICQNIKFRPLTAGRQLWKALCLAESIITLRLSEERMEALTTLSFPQTQSETEHREKDTVFTGDRSHY